MRRVVWQSKIFSFPSYPSFYTRLYRMFLTGFSIRIRIYVAAAITLLTVVLYLLYTLYTQHWLAVTTHEMLNTRLPMTRLIEGVKNSLVTYDDTIFRYLASGNKTRLQDRQALQMTTRNGIHQLLQLSTSGVIRSRLQLLQKESDQYFSDAERLLAFSQKMAPPAKVGLFQAAAWVRALGERRKELALLSSEGRTRLTGLFALCEELVTLNRVELEKARSEMDTALRRSRRAAWAAGGMAGGIVLLIAIGLAVSLLGPLRELLEGVRRVEGGDLNFEIPVTESDEIGQLTTAFNRMTRTVREQREQLLRETITDALTGAYNQRYFHRVLQQELDRARRSNHLLSLLMLDIDHFKTYNDSQGHELGSILLKKVCDVIRDNLREIDILARYGGDEFCAILPETPPEEARNVVARIMEAVASCRFPGQETLPGKRLTLSIGGASFPVDARSANDLLIKADEALYAAKQAGRACLRWTALTTLSLPK
ncbi:MAG: diguanylate cyclase [Elusimicrobia bacterium]|nr:diguanylate cyclase [Elusimicrobiota bacterium]